MKKLIAGIIDFKARLTPENRKRFAELALSQKPDALFIACSDSRVAANVFASTDPGDLFVMRNVGNIIPPFDPNTPVFARESAGSAIDFALNTLNVRDIIVCGHSECGAMCALTEGRDQVKSPHLQSWLRHAEQAREKFLAGRGLDPSLTPHNQISQLNVLEQLMHLKSYPPVAEKIRKGEIGLHGWWFDIAKAEVNSYDANQKKFIPI